jgi:hypothetical protein
MSEYCARGVDVLGSLAISDKDLKRIETVARELKDNAWALKSSGMRDAGELLARADKTAGKLRGAIIANAIITGASTAVVVGMAIKSRRKK